MRLCRRRHKVHFMRDALGLVKKNAQQMVTATITTVFAQPDSERAAGFGAVFDPDQAIPIEAGHPVQIRVWPPVRQQPADAEVGRHVERARSADNSQQLSPTHQEGQTEPEGEALDGALEPVEGGECLRRLLRAWRIRPERVAEYERGNSRGDRDRDRQPSVHAATLASDRARQLPQKSGVYCHPTTTDTAGSMADGLVEERTRRQIIRLCYASLDARTLRLELLRALQKVVPIDAAFFATLDPVTLLFTDAVTDPVLQDATFSFLDNEFLADDVNKFVTLARSRTPVRTLEQATARDLEDSPRYRDILAPRALGDELRAVLRTGSLCWGCLCLHRERESRGFSAAEARFVAHLAPHIAAGLRASLLAGQLASATGSPGPGLLVLAEDLSVVARTPVAERWLAEMSFDPVSGVELPPPIYAVAARLRALESGHRVEPELMPRIRLRTAAGRWLTVHASRMTGPGSQSQTAIFLEEARPVEIAPLIMSAHQLTPREAEITQLVLQGLSTAEISDKLCISLNTVQDYLKSIFDKVGVRSRRELVAQLFRQHYLQ
jgi:DNA-binding CsgD family transcriptional regulator